MTDNEKLKPCPFCGGEATTFTILDGEMYRVACVSDEGWCDAEVNRDVITDAINTWNSRKELEKQTCECDMTAAYIAGVERGKSKEQDK